MVWTTAVAALWLAVTAHAQGGAARRVSLAEPRADGDVFVTSLVIDDADGLLAGDVDLLFDASTVDLQGVRSGDLLDGFFLLDNVVDDTLKVSFASAQATSGGGALFDIVTAGPEAPYFNLLLVSLNGDQIPVAYDRVTDVLAADTTGSVAPDTLRAHPNPFNVQTSLSFAIAQPESVRLVIYNARQQRVRILADGAFAAGTHHIRWDGTDDAGREVASGRYVAHLRTAARRASVALALVR